MATFDCYTGSRGKTKLGSLPAGYPSADVLWQQLQAVGGYGLSSTVTLQTMATMLGVAGSIWERKDNGGNVTERWPVDSMVTSIAQKLSAGEALAVSSYFLGLPNNAGDYTTAIPKLAEWERAWLQSIVVTQGAKIPSVRSAWQEEQIKKWCATKAGGCGATMKEAVAAANRKQCDCALFDMTCWKGCATDGFMKYIPWVIGGVVAVGAGYYFIRIAPGRSRQKAAEAQMALEVGRRAQVTADKVAAEAAAKPTVVEAVKEAVKSTGTAGFRGLGGTDDGEKEYVIWGVPEGGSEDTLLLDSVQGRKITTRSEAESFAKLLREKYKARKVRIQEIDLTSEFDWMKATGLKQGARKLYRRSR